MNRLNKRNRAQDKAVNMMLKALENLLGEETAGLFLALLVDSLDKFVEGVEQRGIRTVEIKYNDFFSFKYDMEKSESSCVDELREE